MGQKAEKTKSRILDAAEGVVLRRGFSATSVDDIQEAAGISRGTFFYHFPTKDDLSRALIDRYAELDGALTDEFMGRAEKLVRDPLQQFLIFLTLHEELFENLAGAYPGCLFASYSYEAGLFDEDAQRVVNDSIERWRRIVAAKLQAAIARHPPRVEVDPLVLADLAYGVFQGAFILSRLREDRGVLIDQVRALRTHFEILFDVAEDVGGS